jgi:hypothetical protein
MFRSAKFLSSSFATAAAAALLLAAAAPASAHYTNSGSKYCGYIVFEQNTDSGASGIESKRVSCSKARRMAKAVNRGNLRPFGFRCTLRDHDDPMFIAHSDVKCKSGSRVVTWIAT